MKFLDLFSGIGGFHFGVKQAMPNAKCVLAIDNDKYCQQVYRANFPDTPIASDVTKIQAEDIPQHDLFCAGFNCQPFSIAGKQRGFNDARGTLFFDIIRILYVKRPKYFILENVPQIRMHDNGETFSIILSHLKSLNYNPKVYTLNSIDYGLAQYRKRCFILGGFELSNLPHYSTPKVVGDIMFPETMTHKDSYIYRIYTKSKLKKNIDIRKPLRVGYIGNGRQGERVYSVSAPSITLTAQGGGPAGKTGLYLTDRGIRKLLPRECARLQGFPESCCIDQSNNQAYKQFGNAVSVNVVEDIVRQI